MTNELTTLLSELELLYERKSKLETEVSAVTEEEKILRASISKIMGDSGTRSQYSPNKKVMAYISETSTIKIIDEPVVMAYLKSNGLLAECLRLDLVTVKRYAKVSKMPGTEVSTREALNIKVVQDKVERVTMEESADQWRSRVREERGE